MLALIAQSRGFAPHLGCLQLILSETEVRESVPMTVLLLLRLMVSSSVTHVATVARVVCFGFQHTDRSAGASLAAPPPRVT